MIRIGVVLSTEGGALPRLLLPMKAFVGGPLGSGSQWFSWIHIADVTSAIRYIIHNDIINGALNLTAPNPVTNATLVRTIAKILRRPAALGITAPVLRFILGDMSSMLLDSQRIIPRRLIDYGFTFRYPEVQNALRDLICG